MSELFQNEDTSPGPETVDRSDEEIRTDIEKLYAENDYLKEHNIQVKVDNCVVTLEGVVHTPQSWQRAADLAADVRGVAEIRNHIKVKPGPGNPND